ncbi:HNH endonuclease [Leptolyngbya sp. KIOST-1]|uniref:HNH endonuclease n=1 Tax=Leptolyngbya sp. KIOST-1 TaxID=1229172 RepID=UPI0018CE9EF4
MCLCLGKGSNDEANLALACRSCNLRKGNRFRGESSPLRSTTLCRQFPYNCPFRVIYTDSGLTTPNGQLTHCFSRRWG